MTNKELIDTMQEAIDDMDTQIADLPACSIRTMLVAQREHFSEFLQLVKSDSIVRASYKKFTEEVDRYESYGLDECHATQFAWEACVDLGTTGYVAKKMIGGDEDVDI